MAQTFEKIPDELIPWIEAQPVFFVATAPAVPATHINVSPRGLDKARMVAYRARKNAASIDGLPGLQPILVPEVGGHGRSEV